MWLSVYTDTCRVAGDQRTGLGKQASHSLLQMLWFVERIVYQLVDGIAKSVELRGTVVIALRFHGVSSMPQFHAIAGIVAAGRPTQIVGLPLPDACGVKSSPEAFPCLRRRVEPLNSVAVAAFAPQIECACDVQQFALFPRHPPARPQPALGVFETLWRGRMEVDWPNVEESSTAIKTKQVMW